MVDILSRTQIFVNPFFAVAANTATNLGTVAYTSSDPDFGTAAVWTRSSAGVGRFATVSTTTGTLMTANSAATVGVSLKPSVTMTVDIRWRPSGPSNGAGETLFATGVVLPANVVTELTYQFTTSSTTPATTASLTINPQDGAVGSTLTMSRVLTCLGHCAYVPFSGATTDTALYDYAWTGSVNLSTSTETLHIPEYAPAFGGEGTLQGGWTAEFGGEGTLSAGTVNVGVDLATFSGVGTLSAVISPHHFVTAEFGGSGSLEVYSEISVPVLFVPPAEKVYDGGLDRLFSRVPRNLGITLLKEAGLYRQAKEPTDEEIDAADVAYLGGHEYRVDTEEADDLTLAGYLANLFYSGYGVGPYGGGNYGVPQGVGE